VDDKIVSRLLAIVTVVVTVAWVVSFLAPIVVPDYQPPQEVNIVMMAVVGLFVQLTMKSRNPKEGSKDEESK